MPGKPGKTEHKDRCGRLSPWGRRAAVFVFWAAAWQGAAMALGSFIGYAPAMFCYSLYGHVLDANPGLPGYQIVFGLMAVFACVGIFVSALLVKNIRKNRQQRSLQSA